MNGWLDSDQPATVVGWPRAAARVLAFCMILLGAAAGWLVLTRPVHRIEGDFLEREDRLLADEWLQEQLQNPVAEIRARAHLALARVQGVEAVPTLLQATQDSAPSVRASAAFALGNLYDTRAQPPEAPRSVPDSLIRLLSDDERIVVTRTVAALGKMGWREAAGDVTKTAAPIAATMTALMRMRASDQEGFVAEYLDSDDQDSRWAAALAAGHLGLSKKPLIHERLQPLLTDENSFVRAAALRAAAGGAAEASTLDAVRTNLEHEDVKVQHEASLALAKFEDREPTKSLPAGEPLLDAPRQEAPSGRLLEEDDYQAVAKTLGARLRMETSIGAFDIELDFDQAPMTSEHVRRLAAAGALDGSVIAAVRPNGYAVAAAPISPIRSELNPQPFLRGSVGLMRQGDASGGGFFLCLTALPLADGRYVNFGRLVSGDRLLDTIPAGMAVESVRPTQ